MALKLPAVPRPIAGDAAAQQRFMDAAWSLLNASGLAGAQALPWESAAGLALPGLRGCVMANNANDATNDLDFTAGWVMDDTGFIWQQEARTGKRIDAAFAVGNNAGGLDGTAAVANTSYFPYAIYSESLGKSDVIISPSATKPVLPGAWDHWKRIGALYRTGGVNLAFTAREMAGGALEVLISSPTGATIKSWSGGADDTAQTQTLGAVPTGIVLTAILHRNFFDASPAAGSDLRISAMDQADVAAAGNNSQLSLAAQGAAVPARHAVSIRMRVNTSAQIRYRANGSTVDHTLTGSVEGWIDDRAS